MDKFLEEVMHLDANSDYHGIIRLVIAERDGFLPWNIYRLLDECRFFEAYMTAKLLIGTGSANPVTHLAQALGGLLFGNADDLRGGTALVQSLSDRLPPEQQVMLATRVVQPAIKHLVLNNASIVHNLNFALSVLDILKSGQPWFRNIFDTELQHLPLDRKELARHGRNQARLLTFPTMPAEKSHRSRCAVVAVRDLVFPQNPNSRLLDVGPRIRAAMHSYGWQATACPMHFHDPVTDFRSIIEQCELAQAELLILDDYYILIEHIHVMRAEMLAELRTRLPGIRIVALHLDPWEVPPTILIATAGSVDFVWTPFPSMMVWSEPTFVGKMIYIPLPNAGTSSVPITPLSGEIAFIGSIVGYNWHRVFWMTAAKQHSLPVRFQLSYHVADGLSVLDSYQAYMRRIEAAGCALNFSMRPDLSRVITGRTFEAVLAGALLAQEVNPDMDYYFVSGEHYLAFSTFAELRIIANFIMEHPDEAEEIRKAGNIYARNNYDDEKIIGHIDYRVFFLE